MESSITGQHKESLDVYVSRNRLAQILDCSPRTIDKWRLLGKGPTATKLPTGAIRYRLTDVAMWLRSSQGEVGQ